jgi:hypothetical protein
VNAHQSLYLSVWMEKRRERKEKKKKKKHKYGGRRG